MAVANEATRRNCKCKGRIASNKSLWKSCCLNKLQKKRVQKCTTHDKRHTMYNSVNNMEDTSLMLFSSYSHAPFLVDRCLVCVCSFWIGSVKKEILPIRYSLSWANCFFEIKYSIIRNKMHSLLPCQTSIAWRAIFIPICTLHCTFLFTIKSFASF